MRQPRTPIELADWVARTFRRIADQPDAKSWALLHEGLAARLYEEIYPLSLFAQHHFAHRTDVLIEPLVGQDPDDAIVIDRSKGPAGRHTVQVTCAYEERWDLRMRYFLQHGHVNVLGTKSSAGTERRGLHVHVENEMVDRENLRPQIFERIQTACEGKRLSSSDYLVVAVEDRSCIAAWHDQQRLREFVLQQVVPMNLRYSTLAVVTFDGRTAETFPLNR